MIESVFQCLSFFCSVDQSTGINSWVTTYSSWEMLDSIRSWIGHLNPHSLTMQSCHLFSTPALHYSSVLFWQLQPCLCLWPHHNPILSPFLSPLITSHSLIIPKCPTSPTYPPPSLPTHPPARVTPSLPQDSVWLHWYVCLLLYEDRHSNNLPKSVQFTNIINFRYDRVCLFSIYREAHS